MLNVDQHQMQLRYIFFPLTQPAITCSKLEIETLEQGMKYLQSFMSLLLTLNIFHNLF